MFAPTNKNMHKQAKCWPMSMPMVSKYKNPNDNIIITISISKSSKPQQYTNVLWYDCNGKLSLIIESVAATWIDIHTLQGNEPDQHAIHLTPGCSHVWQPFAKSLLYQNWSPVHGWSLGPQPHSPSHNILKAGVQFGEIAIGLWGLSGPIKTRHVVSTQLKTFHRGQNGVVFNQHRRGLPHRNLEIATTLSLHIPSECSIDPPTCPARSSNRK
jgi:hypothetical protein